ncbi:MAG: hypothetical protein J5827_03820, partial [Oscillospiraceae bacterium]|nr:hypothetical protein [Oscillospiraceae bacterium]
QTEDGGSGDDFAVLLFDTSNDNDDIHVILNSYLDYLTNTQYNFGADETGIYAVKIYRMTKNAGGTFLPYETQQCLTRTNSKFALTTYFDSGRDSFTLIDVAFRDPAETTKNAYHLYVPVFVRKVLNFGFTARVLSGTDYRSGDYPAAAMECAENLGTPVTLCLTYTYDRSSAEWTEALAGGDIGSYGKRIVFHSDLSSSLDAANTKLVLVDKQTNKAYYATLAEATEDEAGYVDFSKFTDSGGEPFAGATLGELAGAASGYPLTEVYYLSVFADKPDADPDENWISKYTVDCEKNLRGTSDDIPAVFSQSSSLRSYSELYLGNIYTVTAELETDLNGDLSNEPRKVVTLSRNTITAEMTTDIQLRNSAAAERTQEMFHSFLVYLKQTNSDLSSETGILSRPSVNAWYSLNGSEPTTPYPAADIIFKEEYIELRLPGSVTISADAKTIKAKVELIYNSEDDITGQFPPKPEESDGSGTSLFIKSNIATSAEQAAYSSISHTADDGNSRKYFGSIAVKQAKFSYDPIILDQAGELSDLSDLKELGINPKDSGDNLQTEDLTHMLVHSIAVLNYDDVADQCGDYAYLQLTVKLSCKDDSDDVSNADKYNTALALRSYLNHLYVGGTEVLPADSSTSVTVRIPKTGAGYASFTDEYNVATIPIYLDVITGVPFETAGHKYANYRITVTANLLDESYRSLLSGLALEKYIIYTNAKIIPDFISP